MFGFFALSRHFILIILVIFGGSFAQAQSQKATVINDGSLVYRDADFDAPVIDTLKIGSVYNISVGKKGPFYKIRIKAGTTGWVADTDMKPGVHRYEPPPVSKNPTKLESETKQKPYFATRYRGVTFGLLNYTEDTLGEKRSALTPFYGFNFHGYNTMMDGEIYIDSNIMMALAPPQYYADYTGKQTEGYVFIANFLFQTVLPQTKSLLFFYGFGPMFKYSHFVIEAPNTTGSVAYPADDMTVGGVFNLGWAMQVGSFSIKPDLKYYWERDSYFGLTLNVGKEF